MSEPSTRYSSRTLSRSSTRCGNLLGIFALDKSPAGKNNLNIASTRGNSAGALDIHPPERKNVRQSLLFSGHKKTVSRSMSSPALGFSLLDLDYYPDLSPVPSSPITAVHVTPPTATFPTTTWPNGAGNNRLKDEEHSLNQMEEKLFYTLKELVHTENIYLRNLRILVHIYFHSLPCLDSDTDLSLIVRNADAMLEIHERIAVRIAESTPSLSLSPPPNAQALARIASQVAYIFIDEGPNLDRAYQGFCSRHGEAAHLVHELENLPTWPAYETHCNTLIARYFGPPTPPSDTDMTSGDRTPNAGTPHDPFSFMEQEAYADYLSDQKLRFQDYAIQPVQRICRYPLMFSQVVDVIPEKYAQEAVNTAWINLKGIVARVDGAKKEREGELRTKIVASRMEFQTPMSSSFENILGPTVLVGSLHVLHRWASATEVFRVKYYGCFLHYNHLVMVKVRKRHSYEPREWLPLRLFEIHDIEDGTGNFPMSFSLSCRDHYFEFGATCPKEKAIWLEALKSTKATAENSWDQQLLDEEGLPTMFDHTLVSSVYPTATYPPSPDTSTSSKIHKRNNSNASIISTISIDPTLSYENLTLPSPSELHSPTMAMAYSMSGSISKGTRFNPSTLLGKSNASQRATIDLRLADVFSENLLAVRAQASRSPDKTRNRTMSGSKGNLGPQTVTKLSMKERRRMSSAETVLSGDSVHFTPTTSTSDMPMESKWAYVLKRAKTPSSPKVRPTLPPIDTAVGSSTPKVEPKTTKNTLRRATSYSAFHWTPKVPESISNPDIERNNSVSSSSSSGRTQSIETPPSSIPPSPNLDSGAVLTTFPGKTESLLHANRDDRLLRRTSVIGYFSKRVNSSPTLTGFFGAAGLTESPLGTPSLVRGSPNSSDTSVNIPTRSTLEQRKISTSSTLSTESRKSRYRFSQVYKLSPLS